MTRQISQIFKSKNVDINDSKNLMYDIFIEPEIKETKDQILGIEVKSAEDVLSFLNFLKIKHTETVKTLDDRFHIEKGYYVGDKVYLVIGQSK